MEWSDCFLTGVGFKVLEYLQRLIQCNVVLLFVRRELIFEWRGHISVVRYHVWGYNRRE